MHEDARSTAEAAARAAGAVIRAQLDEHGGPRRVSSKGSTDDRAGIDLLTEIDLAAEDAVRVVLAERAPGVPVLAEEGGGAAHVRTRWIVDPVDGTTNLVHGFPFFAVSVGLQLDGELVAGCVYDPSRDDAWTASRGGGAACNGRPLRVSTVSKLDQALLLTGFAYDRRERAAWYLKFVKVMLERSQGIRRAGAASLDFCQIAAGRADGYWEFNLKPWDVAAGILLVEEAGGRLSTIAGDPVDLDQPEVLCTNGRIHEEMREILHPLLLQPEAPSSLAAGSPPSTAR